METDKINKEKGVGIKIEIEPKDAYVDDLEWIISNKDIAEIKAQMATREELKRVMDNFIDPNTYKHFLLMNKKIFRLLINGKNRNYIYQNSKNVCDVAKQIIIWHK